MASPAVAKSDLITVTVTVDGQKIPEIYEITQIQVQRQINRIPWAKIVILDGSPSDENFAVSESSTFVPGNEIEIKAGYHSQEATIFKGIVVRHGIRVEDDGKSFLTIVCFDKAVKMTVSRKSSYFLKKSSKEIIEQLVSGAGLSAEVGDTGAPIEEIIQYYTTDWDFVVSRAEANGHIVTVENGKVTSKAPDFSSDSGLLVKYGESIVEIEAEVDARSQLPSVTSKSWDFSGQSVQSGDAQEPSVNQQGNLTGSQLAKAMGSASYEMITSAPVATADLKSWANAQLLKSRMARIRGKVTFPGSAKPKPGQVAELAGLGARFNGKAFISGVMHRIEKGNWSTEAEFGLSPRWFVEEQSGVEASPAAGLLPSVHGLQIGIVKKIHEDPDGQTRIQVDVPMIAPSGDGVWARIASPYATKNAGIFFMPEIGDEVILSFVNNDPSFPMILGSLYSGQRTSPFTPDQPNTNKAIVSNSQIKIAIDDVKKVIEISTPGGHKVMMSDDQKSITIVDSNSNKMEMTSSGVTLSSPGNISIKADGQIQIEAQTNINIKATADLSVQGLNVSAKAQVAFSAQGQAQAELSASGQTTVRGAMVMIN
ncbi:MAG TPA: type VI secretion system tip protein VgrG [Candidatus Angelobacter sp.]|nr:type VI secretion system tip protein VgrG [Candidatus Angelobacter sp.]